MASGHSVEETLKDSVTVNDETKCGDKGENSGQEKENSLHEDNVSHESKKIQGLRNNKKSAKIRLANAKKKLSEIFESKSGDCLPSKSALRRAVNKVKTEMNIIEKIIVTIKEIYCVSGEGNETFIEALDKELEEIQNSVDEICDAVENQLQQRLAFGELESVVSSEGFSKGKSQLHPVSSPPSELEKKC